jgi:hypothetical protein
MQEQDAARGLGSYAYFGVTPREGIRRKADIAAQFNVSQRAIYAISCDLAEVNKSSGGNFAPLKQAAR